MRIYAMNIAKTWPRSWTPLLSGEGQWARVPNASRNRLFDHASKPISGAFKGLKPNGIFAAQEDIRAMQAALERYGLDAPAEYASVLRVAATRGYVHFVQTLQGEVGPEVADDVCTDCDFPEFLAERRA